MAFSSGAALMFRFKSFCQQFDFQIAKLKKTIFCKLISFLWVFFFGRRLEHFSFCFHSFVVACLALCQKLPTFEVEVTDILSPFKTKTLKDFFNLFE